MAGSRVVGLAPTLPIDPKSYQCKRALRATSGSDPTGALLGFLGAQLDLRLHSSAVPRVMMLHCLVYMGSRPPTPDLGPCPAQLLSCDDNSPCTKKEGVGGIHCGKGFISEFQSNEKSFPLRHRGC